MELFLIIGFSLTIISALIYLGFKMYTANHVMQMCIDVEREIKREMIANPNGHAPLLKVKRYVQDLQDDLELKTLTPKFIKSELYIIRHKFLPTVRHSCNHKFLNSFDEAYTEGFFDLLLLIELMEHEVVGLYSQDTPADEPMESFTVNIQSDVHETDNDEEIKEKHVTSERTYVDPDLDLSYSTDSYSSFSDSND